MQFFYIILKLCWKVLYNLCLKHDFFFLVVYHYVPSNLSKPKEPLHQEMSCISCVHQDLRHSVIAGFMIFLQRIIPLVVYICGTHTIVTNDSRAFCSLFAYLFFNFCISMRPIHCFLRVFFCFGKKSRDLLMLALQTNIYFGFFLRTRKCSWFFFPPGVKLGFKITRKVFDSVLDCINFKSASRSNFPIKITQ